MLTLATDRIVIVSAIGTAPEHDPVRHGATAGSERGHPADCVAGQEQQRHTFIAHFLHALELPDIPVLIVADTDEHFALQSAIGREHVAVGAVCDVVPVLLEPIGQGKLQRQEFARAKGQRIIHHAVVLRFAAVRPIEAHVGPRSLHTFRVRVDRVVAGPAIVRLPRVVRALEQDIGRPLVTDDEDHVALPIRPVRAPAVW